MGMRYACISCSLNTLCRIVFIRHWRDQHCLNLVSFFLHCTRSCQWRQRWRCRWSVCASCRKTKSKQCHKSTLFITSIARKSIASCFVTIPYVIRVCHLRLSWALFVRQPSEWWVSAMRFAVASRERMFDTISINVSIYCRDDVKVGSNVAAVVCVRLDSYEPSWFGNVYYQW